MKRNRQSVRLKGYDYAQAGLYFITICTNNRMCLFGEINHNAMALNDGGKMVEIELLTLSQRFGNIKLHEYIIMPNHCHVILEIVGVPLVGTRFTQQYADIRQPQATDGYIGQPQGIAPTVTLGDIVGAFKSVTTNEYIRGVKNYNWQSFNKKIWQRNYYEHIIQNEKSYINISKYITDNPIRWNDDTLNPNSKKALLYNPEYKLQHVRLKNL